MRSPAVKYAGVLALLAGTCLLALLRQPPAHAGGPVSVGGNFGVDGQAFVWDTATPIPYRTDGPTTSTEIALGLFTKAQADARVAAMFQIWQDVPTASISFARAGELKPVGTSFTDGDVNTAAEHNAVFGNCGDERTDSTRQSPIVYDADGSLFTALGIASNVIGFAGPCQLGTNNVDTNRIVGGRAALNGKFHDGNTGNGEISDPDKYDEVFIHEFGHLMGLDHSQINVNVLEGPPRSEDDMFGLPLMFPTLFSSEAARIDRGFPPLARDDEAWISFLYPDSSFQTSFGKIDGEIRFSDGATPLQGANVIARQVDDGETPENESRRHGVSVVSGYLFTGNPGQPVTGDNTSGSNFGSHDPAHNGFYEIPLQPASYTVEIETLDPDWTAGSSVGPLGEDADEQFPLPGPAEFWNTTESDSDNPATADPSTVTAGSETERNIIVNGTAPRFDSFESATGRNDTIDDATPLASGTFSASISPFSDASSSGPDIDVYRLTASAGTNVTVEITARRLDPPSVLDPVIEIVNSAGTRLATCRDAGAEAFDDPCLNDDIDPGVIRDSRLELEVPAEATEFFVRVLDWRGDARPDFKYDLTVSGIPVVAVSLLGVTQCCPNQFVSINPDTGGFTVLSNVGGATDRIAGGAAAVNASAGRFYFAKRSPPRLVSIDTTNGAATETTISSELIALGFHTTAGTLFGVTACCPNQLVSINVGTGALTVVGNVGASSDRFAATAAIDPGNNRFFLAKRGSPKLLIIDTTNGGLTERTLGQEIVRLGFESSSSTLFGVTACCPSQLVSINVATGALTAVGTVGTSADRFSLAVAIDAVNTRCYLAKRASPRLVVLETESGAAVERTLSQEILLLGVE